MSRPGFFKIIAGIARLCRSTLCLYVVTGGLLLGSLDHDKMIRKTMDSLQEAPRYLVMYAYQAQDYHARKLRSAVRYYQYYHELLPQSARGVSALAYSYYHLGRTEKAIECYQKALELQPDLFGLYYNLGVIFYQSGHPKKAAHFLKQALMVPVRESLQIRDVVYPVTLPTGPDAVSHPHQQEMLKVYRHYELANILLLSILNDLKDYASMRDYALRGIKYAVEERKTFAAYAQAALYHLATDKQRRLESSGLSSPPLRPPKDDLKLIYYIPISYVTIGGEQKWMM